jgi:amidohydrolase
MPAMAGSELLEIQLEGVGGHGAAPHLTADPILAAAQVITSLQSVVSRNVNPSHEAVVSITWIEAGQAFNIIPERVVMRGTVRTFDPQVRSLVIGRIKEIVEGVAGAMGCKAEIHLQEFTPPVRNDPALAEKIQSLARRLYPEARIVHDERTMGSEDFAFFSRDIPGCFIFIGSQNTERGLDAPHHNPRFDFDEEALGRGAALIAAAAWMLLEAE